MLSTGTWVGDLGINGEEAVLAVKKLRNVMTGEYGKIVGDFFKI